MPSKHPILTICLTFLLLQGCSNNSSIFSRDNLPLVHRIDVQQGNVITQDMLAKLELGMEKKKVRFIMGTPLISDTFHNDRWDYIYTYKKGRDTREQRRVTLFFEKDLLARIDGDVVAARGKIPTDTRKMESVEVPPADPPGLFSRVKEKMTFGDDKPEVDKKVSDETTESIEPEMESKEAKVSEELDLEMDSEDVIDVPLKTTDDSTEEEEKGFFGRMWDKVSGDNDKTEVDPNDPILTDPEINPDY